MNADLLNWILRLVRALVDARYNVPCVQDDWCSHPDTSMITDSFGVTTCPGKFRLTMVLTKLFLLRMEANRDQPLRDQAALAGYTVRL